MKNLFLLFITILMFTSCQKDDVNQNAQIGLTYKKSVSIYGGKWVVRDAKMYLINEKNGNKIYYDHFSNSKTSSSLRISGSLLDIETIIKDTTTWEFLQGYNGIGRFVLNGDYNNQYGFQNSSSDYFRIIENPENNPDGSDNDLNGSSVPFTPKYLTDNKIEVRLYYVNEGVNFINQNGEIDYAPTSYFTILILEKI